MTVQIETTIAPATDVDEDVDSRSRIVISVHTGDHIFASCPATRTGLSALGSSHTAYLPSGSEPEIGDIAFIFAWFDSQETGSPSIAYNPSFASPGGYNWTYAAGGTNLSFCPFVAYTRVVTGSEGFTGTNDEVVCTLSGGIFTPTSTMRWVTGIVQDAVDVDASSLLSSGVDFLEIVALVLDPGTPNLFIVGGSRGGVGSTMTGVIHGLIDPGGEAPIERGDDYPGFGVLQQQEDREAAITPFAVVSFTQDGVELAPEAPEYAYAFEDTVVDTTHGDGQTIVLGFSGTGC